jgi:type I restriction enzyme S subunit
MSPIPPRYISLFLKTPYYWSSIQDNTAGIAIPNVNATKLANLKIPLSPLPEQHRIVTKLETLLAQVNRSKDHLAKVPPLIKRFRQSVLAAACSGRLTEDWRREHLNVEHASELLNRIREERIRRYEEECRKAEAEGRRKPKKPKNIEPQKVDAKGLPELPEGWVWTKLESACSDIVDCPHSTPKFQTDGKYCIDTTCINGGKIDFKKIRYVSEKTYQERIKRLKPRLNDVIFSREGTIGNAVLLLDLDFCMGQRVMLFRSNSSVVPNYLVRYLNSQLLKDQYVHLTIGSTSPHINVGDIKNMLTPLPSLAEQRVIVEQVETLFHFADEVEQRVAAATTHTNHLTQSILARAFRGELVPQDLNDEPASVLLERIKQARAELKEKKKTQKGISKTLLDFN